MGSMLLTHVDSGTRVSQQWLLLAVLVCLLQVLVSGRE